jgi:hypothetical protein
MYWSFTYPGTLKSGKKKKVWIKVQENDAVEVCFLLCLAYIILKCWHSWGLPIAFLHVGGREGDKLIEWWDSKLPSFWTEKNVKRSVTSSCHFAESTRQSPFRIDCILFLSIFKIYCGFHYFFLSSWQVAVILKYCYPWTQQLKCCQWHPVQKFWMKCVILQIAW